MYPDKKNILICVDWFFPAYKAGGPVISLKNLVDNYRSNVSYWILCSDTDLNGEKLQDIETDRWLRYDNQTNVFYCSAKSRKIWSIISILNNVRADVLYVNGVFSPYFNIVPLLLGKAILKVLAPRGMFHQKALQQKKIKKSFFIFLFKLLRVKNKVRFHATNNLEGDFVRKLFGSKIDVLIAENFPRKISGNKKFRSEGKVKLCTIALISPMKNYHQVLKALKNNSCLIEYSIYGPVKESSYWEECLAIINEMPENIKVKYYGDIKPSDVPGVLDQNDIYIQPSESENFGHSLYEALSSGLPTITSHGTPWNDLRRYKAGFNVDPKNLYEINAAIYYLSQLNGDEFSEWISSARSYASSKINVDQIVNQYDKLFQAGL